METLHDKYFEALEEFNMTGTTDAFFKLSYYANLIQLEKDLSTISPSFSEDQDEVA